MLVSAGPGVRGLVPRLHASDLGTAKAMQKFKVGALLPRNYLAACSMPFPTISTKESLIFPMISPPFTFNLVALRCQVGQKVAGRVLEVDVGARRMTLTLKPGLTGSRLQPLASLQQAAPGVKAHGMVTGVKVCGKDAWDGCLGQGLTSRG